MAVVVAVIVNYFVIGYGPSWAHGTPPPEKGSTWRANKDQGGLPHGTPRYPVQPAV